MPEKLSVIITGATGCAGSGVLYACLASPQVEKVSVITRKPTGIEDGKLSEIIHADFLDYSEIEEQLQGHDACFWCLGVSQSKVRNETDYTRITYDFTMAAAKILERVNPGMTFCFLSGTGTDQTGKSRMMWVRVKGKAEKDLADFDLKNYSFRPGFIAPGPEQRNCSKLGSLLYPFIKNSRKYCVESGDFGMAMINAALFGSEKQILENADIRDLAARTE